MARVDDLLNQMVLKNASDLFISAGFPIHIKIEGELSELNSRPLSAEDTETIANKLMSEVQRHKFADKPEVNLGISLGDRARFRVNIFRQQGTVAIVIRYLPTEIPKIDQLGLPSILHKLVELPRGMVLVVGATGSGKSTSLAAMIDHRNETMKSHILTIEDPMEYVHRYKQSVVNQREIGLDTQCYADALKNAMREAPDVILIGEIRDQETMQDTISYSETGHLCLSTLHASNASHALDRIINFFPENARNQILSDLSRNLKAVISQRLVRGVDGNRIPAVEIMLVTPLVSDLIAKGNLWAIREQMEKSLEAGAQTFDQSLLQLALDGKISKAEALAYAESASNLKVQFKLRESNYRKGADELSMTGNFKNT